MVDKSASNSGSVTKAVEITEEDDPERTDEPVVGEGIAGVKETVQEASKTQRKSFISGQMKKGQVERTPTRTAMSQSRFSNYTSLTNKPLPFNAVRYIAMALKGEIMPEEDVAGADY